jgi:hypothetical protein
MNKGRVGEERGSKETDGCPLTLIYVLQTVQKLCKPPPIPLLQTDAVTFQPGSIGYPSNML